VAVQCNGSVLVSINAVAVYVESG